MATRPRAIPFGEWLPDLPEHLNPGALIARNVLPEIDSYRSLRSVATFSNALEKACLGAFWIQSSDGTVFNFAGDTNTLYRLSGTTWTDVSGDSAPYGAEWWEFTNFGDRVIAASKADPLQYFDTGSSQAFADLPGNPPQAARIATVRDFVVVGDLASLGPHYVQWSGFNNSEIWTPSLATQSDYQSLVGRGGRVQRIVPGEYGIIFQEHSITRMDYVGPPTIFQFDEVERGRGTPAPGSVLWTGPRVFYYGWDGFYVFNGVESTPISHNRVSRWFENQAASGAVANMRGAVDRLNRMVIWAFSTNSGATFNNRLLIYNWAADKWSYAEVNTEVLAEYSSPGYTLDELDSILADIDSESINVDSTAYQGGEVNLQVFNSSHRSGTFSGDPMPATIDTKEISSQTGRRLYVNSIEPLVESDTSPTITIRVGTRDKSTANVTFTPARGLNARTGEANIRASGRYMRFRVDVQGGMRNAAGVVAHIAAEKARR